MKQKILIFSGAYYPKHIGGAEVAIKEITDRISCDDIEFHMITNRFDSTLPKVEQVGNILVHRIGMTTKNPDMAALRTFPLHLSKLFYQYTAHRAAKRLHKEHGYEAIWAMMAHSCGVPAAKFKHLFPDVRYILTLQEGDPPEYIERKMRFFGQWFNRAFTSADVIQSISTFLDAWARRRGFVGTSMVIPNAVDVAHFSQTYASKELEVTAKELGKQPGDVLLVTTSRLVHKNGIDTVIEALVLLPKHVKFIIFGTGPEQHALEKLVALHGLRARVSFRGHIEHKDMPRFLKACDVFVRPSRSEGMGNSFVEAMAARLPVIATQEGGISDFLFDADRNPEKQATGWAVDTDAPAQIADAVRAITDDASTTRKTIEHAHELVEHTYNWDSVAQRMQQEVFSTMGDSMEEI